MFGDIGWAELLLIGVVALIVIGPEDLPGMFRQLGRFTAKMRQMSREFSRAMEDAAKTSGVKDVASDLRAVTSPSSLGLSKVKEAADRFEKWDPLKPAAKPVVPVTTAAVAVPAAVPEAAGLSAVVSAAPEPVIHGPATQALLDKKAAKQAVVAETTTKLKAIDTATEAAPPAAATAAFKKPKAVRADIPVVAEPGVGNTAAPKTLASKTPGRVRKAKKADDV